MKRNMGCVDRAVRAFLVAPAAIVAAVLLGPTSGWSIALWAVTAVMLVSAAVGFCLLYVPLGIDTRGKAVGRWCGPAARGEPRARAEAAGATHARQP